MGFSIAHLFQVSLLLLNALAILSERRFLSKFGLATASFPNDAQAANNGGDANSFAPFGGGENFGGFGAPSSPVGGAAGVFGRNSQMKSQIATLLSSVRMLMRWPLIFLNTVTVVFALIFG